jgi:SAM-dependent methyltransferase
MAPSTGASPYQSIFLSRQIVVPGRRNDALERLQFLPPDFFRGRTVLDVASNFGMSALLARSLGAESCLGLELSPEMVDFGSRFAMFDGAYPHVRYEPFNIDTDSLPADARFDIAFMFSIHDHLEAPQRLVDIARDHVVGHVVFEGHPGAQRADYERFFDSGLFRSVTQIGTLPESVFKPERNRVLWLCEKG